MSNLIPEQRLDKNGRLNTKLVRADSKTKSVSPSLLSASPKVGGVNIFKAMAEKKRNEKDQRELLESTFGDVQYRGTSPAAIVKKIKSPEAVSLALEVADKFREVDDFDASNRAVLGLMKIIDGTDKESGGIRAMHNCQDFILEKMDEGVLETPAPAEVFSELYRYLDRRNALPDKENEKDTFAAYYNAAEEVIVGLASEGEVDFMKYRDIFSLAVYNLSLED